MKRFALLIVALVAMMTIFAGPAYAGPIIKGGVPTKAAAKKAYSNKYVKKGAYLLGKRYGYPTSVVDKLLANGRAGKIHYKSGFSAKRGTQTYRNGSKVGITTSSLAGGAWYTEHSVTTYETTKGVKYKVVTRYRYYLRKKCGNGKMEEAVVTKTVCPEEHRFCVTASGEYDCLDPAKVSATLIAGVTEHSDGDCITYTWCVNGVNYTTTEARYGIDLQYGVWYNITLTAVDADGHTATAVLAPRRFTPPGDEPPVPNP